MNSFNIEFTTEIEEDTLEITKGNKTAKIKVIS